MSYSQFCRQYRTFKKTLKPSMRQIHQAGDKTFVDYAGPTVPIYNCHSEQITQAIIFVGVLGASNYTYAEATLTRSLSDWIGSHNRMFDYFGGVSRYIIPDNEKSAIVSVILSGGTGGESITALARSTFVTIAASGVAISTSVVGYSVAHATPLIVVVGDV